MKRIHGYEVPEYETPEDTVCPNCGEPCTIVPLLNHFSYSGTHCTHGADGVEFPYDWGRPVSDCCEAEMEV